MSEAKPPERSFEENLTELEAIVRELEDGKTTLETAIQRYESGVKLVEACSRLLREAEQKIVMLTGAEAGQPVTEPFGAPPAAPPEKPPSKREKPAKPSDPEIPF
jgi:exodeoxyribonuclease VII small subunit